jgi:ectoine hydroxylase-related dioxygenase (phytanoyl-CoA dioxygenase family)
MRASATADQIARYREDGFVIVRDLLDPAELRELTEAVERGIELTRRTMGRNKVVGGRWEEGQDAYFDAIFLQRVNLWKIEPTVRRYMLGPEIGRIATELAGVEGLRVWHDQTLQKKPWSNPTNWHLDHPYYSYHERGTISAWIALDDATIRNGCLHYLPGSQRIARADNVEIGPSMDGLFAVYPELAGIEPVAAEMSAGSCAFHDGMIAHAAGPNMTPRWRRAMTCAYMPVGARFNGQPNILSAERLARLKPGDSLDDEAENPLVWRVPAEAV